MSSSSSTTDGGTARLSDRIEVGRIVRPRGLGGEVVVQSSSDAPGRFAPGARLELAAREGKSTPSSLTVRAASWLKPGLVALRFDSVETREAAEALQGARLEIARKDVPPAAAGEYWQFDLVGCRAWDERAGELGEVVDVIDAGGGPLLVVALADGRKVPLPFVERFLVAVDLAAKRIDWRLPEGLIEACASKS